MTLACGGKGARHNHTRSCTLLSVSDLERIKLERPLLKAVRPGPARLGNAPRSRPHRGFTLVEILVVMAIILLIAALVIVALVKIYKVVKTLMSEG